MTSIKYFETLPSSLSILKVAPYKSCPLVALKMSIFLLSIVMPDRVNLHLRFPDLYLQNANVKLVPDIAVPPNPTPKNRKVVSHSNRIK